MTKTDKSKHHESMAYFRELLELKLGQTYPGIKLLLIAFGLRVDDTDNYLYFDYPYLPIVDQINARLQDRSGAFAGLDRKIYTLLENRSANMPCFIAYRYNFDEVSGILSIMDIKSSLSGDLLEIENVMLKNFFSVMFYSAKPTKLKDLDMLERLDRKSDAGDEDTWFLFIHNVSVQGQESNLISNYCLDAVPRSVFEDADKLQDIVSLLIKFATNYGSAQSNIVLKQVKQHSDQLLSTNYLLFHWLKQRHMVRILVPLKLIGEERSSTELHEIISDSDALDTFFERYVANYKTLHRKENLVNFDGLKRMLENWDRTHAATTNLVLVNRGAEAAAFQCNEEYTRMMFESILENGEKALREQDIVPAIIKVYWTDSSRDNRDYISITITSVGTRILQDEFDTIGYEPQRQKNDPNTPLKGSGIGLYLANKHLGSLDAYRFEDELYFEKLRENSNQENGFTLTFLLPKYQ